MSYEQEIIDITFTLDTLRRAQKEIKFVLEKEVADTMGTVIVYYEELKKHVEKSHEIHCKILETCKDYRNADSLNAMACALALLIKKASEDDDELYGIELINEVIKTLRYRLKNDYNFNIKTEE